MAKARSTTKSVQKPAAKPARKGAAKTAGKTAGKAINKLAIRAKPSAKSSPPPRRGPASGPHINVVVTLDEAQPVEIKKTIKSLGAKGLSVGHVMESIGIVGGSAPHARLGDLRSIKGVRSVEPEGPVQIAPPDAPVQ